MIRTCIVGDESSLRQDLKVMIQRHPAFSIVGDCGNVSDARMLIRNVRPELLFLDFKLVNGNGFELLRTLYPYSLKVVFMTVYNRYVIKAMKYAALDYLLKPLDEKELAAALDHAAKGFDTQVEREQLEIAESMLAQRSLWNNRIVIGYPVSMTVIYLEEIMYCQSVRPGYTEFYLTEGRKALSYSPIEEYEELLPAATFIQVHESYLVNRHYIDLYNLNLAEYLNLTNGVNIPVSPAKREAVIRFLAGK